MRDIAQERRDMDTAVDGWTVCSALAEAANRRPDEPMVEWRGPDGNWQGYTRREYREKIRDVALGLAALGFAPGEFGLVMGANRPEHAIADLAITHARGTSVSVYNTLAPDQVAWIANHCEATVALVENEGYLDKYRQVRDQLPHLRRVVLIEGDAPGDDWVVRWDDLLAMGAKAHADDPAAFDRMWQQVRPEDLLSLIYTSGTTGTPKGVMYSHYNILWTAESMVRHWGDIVRDARLVSYLPLAHVAERFTSHWAPIWNMVALDTTGVVRFCPDINQLLPYLLETRPNYFVGVPRVWEKFQTAIRAGVAAEQNEELRGMILQAIEAGRHLAEVQLRGDEVPEGLAHAVEQARPIHQAILAKIGLDQCRLAITTTAPTPIDLKLFWTGLGMQMGEVWGMSELTGPATASTSHDTRLDSCGTTIPGVEAKLADDGELLIRGGNVMVGYYRAPEQTAETIEPDGWLHTGDIAQVDATGHWRIVDRKKELIITSSGKNIAPAQVESLLKMNPLIGQALAVGDNRNYVTAVLVLDPEMAPLWAQRQGLEGLTLEQLAEHPQVVAAVREGVAQANAHLARIEQVKRFVLLGEEWTPQSGMLTPTQKMRRRVVMDEYAHLVDGMYADPPLGHDVGEHVPGQRPTDRPAGSRAAL